jgi:hypothetical protein
MCLPCGRVRQGEVTAEPANERYRRGGGGASPRLGGSGGVHVAVVVGGSVEVGDVLFGDDDGESGMHGWTSFRRVVRAL